MNNSIEYIKNKLEEYLNEITEKSKNKMYVCPLCKSGTGQHKTGAFNIIPSSNGTAWKCHACGRGGTIIDLYSMINNIDTKEAIKQLLNKYDTSSIVLGTPQALPEQPRKKVKDYTNFFRMAERNINQTNYLKDVRKISQETISFFHCGYIPKFSYYDDNIQKFTSAIIIPTSDNSYMWRSTQNNEKRKQGKTHLLNTYALYQYQDSKIQWHNAYCVIVEGELDCLSVFDVDKNVIGLGSVNMVDTLIQTYCDIFHGRQQQYCPLLIFALDNDEVGKKWTDIALLECNKHNIACISADVQKLYGGHKDANEMIVKSNSLELKNNLEKEILKMLNKKYNYRPNDIIKEFQKQTQSNQQNNNMVAHRNGNGNNSTSSNVPMPLITFENISTPEVLEYIYTLKNKIDIINYVQLLKDKAKEFKKLGELSATITAYKKEALRRLEEQERQSKLENVPQWLYLDKKNNYRINEPLFCAIKEKELKCKTINGNIRTIDGIQLEDNAVISKIQHEISKYIIEDIAKRSEKLLKALKYHTFSELPQYDDNIHFVNGTYHVNTKTFENNKYWCVNRIATAYNPNAQRPTKWLKYLGELLGNEDIATLQEFCGYCLIPSTTAQVMLFLLGSGGEGKSIIGKVLNALIGKNNIYNEKIHELQENRFKLVNCENKLMLIDDDLQTKAIKDTGILKTIVTGGRQTVEPKGKPSYEADLYSRILCFGNIPLVSLYDHSDGFYRRQVIIKTKPKPKDRIVNPFLDREIIITELEGILLWCLEGLHRLINNKFKISISKASQQALEEAKKDAFNFLEFLTDTNEVEFNPNYSATSSDIYANYCRWCSANATNSFKQDSIMKWLSEHAEEYNIQYNKYVKDLETGKYVRGYKGIHLLRRYSINTISFN